MTHIDGYTIFISMNQNNTAPSSPAPKSRIPWLQYLMAGVLLLALLLVWRELAETKQSLAEVREQNSDLKGELKLAKNEVHNLSSGDPSPASKEQLAAARAEMKATVTEEKPESLFLQQPTVQQTDKGLVVRFEFKPGEGVELPDDLSLVVRIPRTSTSKLISLAPVSAPEDSSRSIIKAGYIGLIQCSPADMGTMAFEFTVSEPVTAIVSGTEGINGYELDIAPDGCTFRKR